MDEAFNSIKEKGKNDIDGVVQWMKDATVIDDNPITEAKVREVYAAAGAKGNIELDKFKEGLNKLARESKSSVDILVNKLNSTGSVVKDAFVKLKRDGKNDADSLIKWMKDSNIIDSAKESEERARKLLSDEKDRGKVKLSKFKATVNQLSQEKLTILAASAANVASQAQVVKDAVEAAAASQALAVKDAVEAATASKDAVVKDAVKAAAASKEAVVKDAVKAATAASTAIKDALKK